MPEQMPQQMPFIGRQEELKRIDDAIKESGTRQVLCLDGVGGIGKTRLLTEVHRLYTGYENDSWLVVNILDFDDRTLHVLENIESQIAEQLDKPAFEPYLRGLQDLRKITKAGVSLQTIKRQSEEVFQLFQKEFNKLSRNKRIILLFDTTEKLINEEVLHRLINFIIESTNTVFLLAGRNAKELYIKLENDLATDAKLIKLDKFKKEISQDYLLQKQNNVHLKIDPEVQDKLLLLADGRPILLDLAVEWLSRDLPRDWMTEKSLTELQSLSQEDELSYKKDFEIQLVRHITQIRDQMDQLTLVMSRIYPLTSSMISKLLRISDDEAKRLFKEAQTYVFVKSLPDGRISLHDEMRRMINQYVWPEVDPQERRRRRDSKIAAELFEAEDQQLRERISQRNQLELTTLFEQEALFTTRQVVNQQQIEHAFYSDAKTGFDVWKKIVRERRNANEFGFAKSLIGVAQNFYQQFDANQQFEFDLLKARLANDTGEVREAELMLHELLKENKNIEEREAELYNALGLVEEKIGKLVEARDHQLQSLDLFKKINPKAVPLVANRVGYIHRLLHQLTEAETYYNQGLQAALKVEPEKRNLRLIASLLNNLGYVYGLQRQYYRMEFNSQKAIDIWSKIGAEREIGRAEAARAVLYRERGELDQAIDLLQNAISRYKEPDDHEKLSRAYFELGWTEWYKAEKIDEKATDIRELDWYEDQLEKARNHLIKSKTLAENYGLEALLPGIWHLTGLVNWYLGRVREDHSLQEEARQLNIASYQKSIELADNRYAISSLLADAEWDYEIEEYGKIEHYAQELEKYPSEPYRLYFGRMRRIEADVALSKGDYQKAFSHYAVALPLIRQAGGFGRYTIERELLRLGNKIAAELNPTEIEKLVGYLYQTWLEMDNQDSHLLVTWCDQQLLRAQLRSLEL